MVIVESQRFVGGHVFKTKKMTIGEGALACNNLCQANNDCWSWNFGDSKSMCYLMSSTEDEATSQSKDTWVSGYRECNESEEDWDNEPTATGASENTDLVAKNVAITGGVAQVSASWTDPAAVSPLNASFRVACMKANGSCFDTVKAKLDVPKGSGSTPQIVPITTPGSYTCYVQTRLDGAIAACSAGTNLTVAAA